MPGIPRDDEATARESALEVSKAIRGGVAAEGTVAAWWTAHLEAREARGIKTVGDQRGRFRNWLEKHIGEKRPASVSSDDLRELVLSLDQAVLEEELSWKTALNVWGDVTAAFDEMLNSKSNALAVLRGRANPCEGVRGPDRGETREKPFLYPEELTALLDCEEVPRWRRRMYAVASYSGLRANELAALTPDDVDLEHSKIHVTKQTDRKTGNATQTKTKRNRSIDIEPALVPLLEILLKERPEKLLRMPPDEDRARLLREDLEQAGCKRQALFANDASRSHIVFHGLRDTCLSHMAIRGDSLPQVQWRAGHSSFEMTQKYIEAARKVATGFGTPFPPLPTSLLSGRDTPDPPPNTPGGGSEPSTLEQDSSVFGPENTSSIPVGVAKSPNSSEELEMHQTEKPASQTIFSGPDEALRQAIKAYVDAGEYERAAKLLDILRSGPAFATVRSIKPR